MGDEHDDQSRLDLDRRVFRDSCRTGTGLVVNGFTVPVTGFCVQCGHRRYSESERGGLCCDCSIADCKQGHRLARSTEAGWLALDAHETRYQHVEAYEDEPAYTLGLRSCARCHTTISRVVEKEAA